MVYKMMRHKHLSVSSTVGLVVILYLCMMQYAFAGSIVGWGGNIYGEAKPPDGNDFVAIAAGDGHSLALRSDGSIVGWGRGCSTPPDGNGYI